VTAPRVAELPDWPRAMCEDLAAAYVGLSVTTIRKFRAANDFPAPIRPRLNGAPIKKPLYLREQLDAWLDQQAGAATASQGGDPWMTR
jgi:hypothetical protein